MKTTQIIECSYLHDSIVEIKYTGEFNDESQRRAPEVRTHDLYKICEERAADLGIENGHSLITTRAYEILGNFRLIKTVQVIAKTAGYSIEIKDNTLRVCLPEEVPPYLVAALAVLIGQNLSDQKTLLKYLEISENGNKALIGKIDTLNEKIDALEKQLKKTRHMTYQSTVDKKRAFMTGINLKALK